MIKIYKDKKGKYKISFEVDENNLKVVYEINHDQASTIYSLAANAVQRFGITPIYCGGVKK